MASPARVILAAVAAAFLAAACGCDPEFREPLSNAETSKVDEDLLGAWYLVPNGDPMLKPEDLQNSAMIFRRRPEPTVLEVEMLDERRPRAPGEKCAVFTTKIKKQCFASLPSVFTDNDPKQRRREPHQIYAYQIKDKTLQIFPLNEDAFGDAIANGKLKGEAPRVRRLIRFSKYEFVAVTDSVDKVRAFLAENADQCISTTPLLTLSRTPPLAGPKERNALENRRSSKTPRRDAFAGEGQALTAN